MIKQVLGVVMLIIVLGALIPVLWPMMEATDTDIQALMETGPITVFLQTMWPIVLLVIGIGVAAGLVFYSLKKFGVIGR